MWSSLSLCKQKERREDEVQRGNPLFKCQAVRAILSLPFLFPLFCTSQGSDSPPSSLLRCLLCVSACGRDCVGVHVPARGSHLWSGHALGKDDTDRFCLCATRIYRQGRRGIKTGYMLEWEDAAAARWKRWKNREMNTGEKDGQFQ